MLKRLKISGGHRFQALNNVELFDKTEKQNCFKIFLQYISTRS